MLISSAAKSVKGKASAHNQDSIYCNDEAGVWLLADGMGGHTAGREASRLICRDLPKLLLAGNNAHESIRLCHNRLIMSTSDELSRKGMGSTFLLVVKDRPVPETISQAPNAPLQEQTFHIFWVGDSRAYIADNQKLSPVTKDHSVVQNLIDLQLLDEKGARSHPERNLLTQCLGGNQINPPQIGSVTVKISKREHILMCSDGLYNELTNEEIYDFMGLNESYDEIVCGLINEVEQRQGRDDVSVILLGQPIAQLTKSEWVSSRFFKPIKNILALFKA